MNNTFREKRKENDLKLINLGKIFNEDKGKKPYLLKDKEHPSGFWTPKADLLIDGKNNLFFQIIDEVISYFAMNKITFHHNEGDSDYGLCIPSGHTISSQISCINHLFPFRKDKKAVEDLFRLKDAELIDDGYISFEFVNQNIRYLKERNETRGKDCTSIDAFVKISNIGIGIEWKYTETDYDTSKAEKYWQERYNTRYQPLLENSNIIENDSLISCQMYYELMRQTLLLEQMANHNEIKDYKNIVVCPKGNIPLFECCENWKSFLKDPSKFEVIDPKELFSTVNKTKYKDLLEYLEIRYW